AKFGDRGSHRGILDHSPIITIGHRRHVTVAVPRTLIGREQPELLGGGARGEQAAGEVAVGVADATTGSSMAEAVDRDPHRYAGGAAPARRPIGKTVAAAKAGTRQIVVCQRGAAPAELHDQLALGSARQIGAGDGYGDKELPKRRGNSIACRGSAR